MRTASAFGLVLLVACSSGSSSSSPSGCPDVSGPWKVTQHCETSLVGMAVVVTETDCKLSFGAPFDQFSGTVTTDGRISLSGPQTCTGTGSSSSIAMTCTPATCAVTLGR